MKMRADSSVACVEFELQLELPELAPGPGPELFKRPASAESRNNAARSAVGARSSVGPPRKSSRK